MHSRWTCLAVVGSLLLTSACEEELSPEEQTIANVEAQTAPIESALQSPTGSVSADNVGSIFEAIEQQGAASSAASYVPGGTAPMSDAQDFGPGTPCVTSVEGGGTVDLGCASGGAVTGSVTYQAATQDNTTYLSFSYDQVCSEGDCIDGQGSQKYINNGAGGFTALMAGDFTATTDGVTTELSYGFQMTIDGAGISVAYVVFVDGQSYVVSYEYDGETFTYQVDGANGSYTCTATQGAEGWTGSCTGSASFDF